MQGKFVGPMPVTDFLAEFLPPPPRPMSFTANPFEVVAQGGPGNFEDRWIKAVKDSGMCPTVDFCNTTHPPGVNFPYRTMVNVSGVSKNNSSSLSSHAAQLSEGTPLFANWTTMEITVRCGYVLTDPFVDPYLTEMAFEPWDRHAHEFESDTDEGTTERNQLLANASAHMASQFRTFCFSICLLGCEARLLRWDRSGAIVTERFDYTKDIKTLAEFLWRFNHLCSKDRGHDPTVVPATLAEIEQARKHDHFILTADIYRVAVHHDADDTDHHYLVSAPMDWDPTLTGRATRGYVALDIKTKDLVWLKDSWRIDMDGFENEVDIYALLHRKGVDHIAPMVYGGDVIEQKTLTRDYLDKEWCCGKVNIVSHRHCRLVLGVIGCPLHEFTSSKELCQAVYDAMEGHWEAYSKAGVLHRDVSGGNILITPDGRGMIIDWDLCKKTTAPVEARRNWRTGTWRFISAAILQEHGKMHELSDDLEAFLHVILYHALRYRAACATLVNLQRSIDFVFESFKVGEDGQLYGGDGKRSFFSYNTFNEKLLAKVLPPPLAKLIASMRIVICDIYSAEKPWATTESVEQARKLVQTSDHFLQLLRDSIAAEGWAENDGGIDLLARNFPKGRKRPSPDRDDSDDESSSKRRREVSSPSSTL